MTPDVQNQKTDGNLGVSASTARILAIIAPAEKGPSNTATPCANPDEAYATFGVGQLSAAATHVLDIAQVPTVLVRCGASTAGAYGAIDSTGKAGTSVITAGVTPPLDDFDVTVQVVVGGTIGVSGITYRYSFDGGASWSAPVSLGTANTIAIPDSGVGFALGAGTLLANDTWKVTSSGPRPTSGDLTAALAALREYDGEWLRVLVGGHADATIISQLDVDARAYWPLGKNPEVVCNSRPRGATGESRAQYQTAIAAITSAVQTAEVSLCVDQCEIVVRGRRTRRPTAWPFVARLMRIDDSVDAAAVADGALPGVFLTTPQGVKAYHDEALYPGLDELGVTTLRTFRGRPRRPGCYVNNPRVLAGPTSDYQYFQLSAIINRVIERTHSLLEPRLSSNVILNPDTGLISEDAALAIEDDVNGLLRGDFVDPVRVSAVRMRLGRTDPILTNGGFVTYVTEVVPLGTIKKFIGKTRLVRALTST